MVVVIIALFALVFVGCTDTPIIPNTGTVYICVWCDFYYGYPWTIVYDIYMDYVSLFF